MKIRDLLERKLLLTFATSSMCMLLACGTSRKINTNYLMFNGGADTLKVQLKEPLIQPGDFLSIQVSSRTLNQEQTAIFNNGSNGNAVLSGYKVSAAGNVEMPVIGSIPAAGLTNDQFQSELERRLVNNVKNPSVRVSFLHFNVNVLGEVRTPGIQRFNVERVTLIDALGAAGDLTDFGRRENVKVIRDQDGDKIQYVIDLRDKAMFQSPVYFLRPNDIIYVSPSISKIKNLSADPDKQRRTGFVLTLVSLVVSVGTLLMTAFR